MQSETIAEKACKDLAVAVMLLPDSPSKQEFFAAYEQMARDNPASQYEVIALGAALLGLPLDLRWPETKVTLKTQKEWVRQAAREVIAARQGLETAKAEELEPTTSPRKKDKKKPAPAPIRGGVGNRPPGSPLVPPGIIGKDKEKKPAPEKNPAKPLQRQNKDPEGQKLVFWVPRMRYLLFKRGKADDCAKRGVNLNELPRNGDEANKLTTQQLQAIFKDLELLCVGVISAPSVSEARDLARRLYEAKRHNRFDELVETLDASLRERLEAASGEASLHKATQALFDSLSRTEVLIAIKASKDIYLESKGKQTVTEPERDQPVLPERLPEAEQLIDNDDFLLDFDDEPEPAPAAAEQAGREEEQRRHVDLRDREQRERLERELNDARQDNDILRRQVAHLERTLRQNKEELEKRDSDVLWWRQLAEQAQHRPDAVQLEDDLERAERNWQEQQARDRQTVSFSDYLPLLIKGALGVVFLLIALFIYGEVRRDSSPAQPQPAVTQPADEVPFWEKHRIQNPAPPGGTNKDSSTQQPSIMRNNQA